MFIVCCLLTVSFFIVFSLKIIGLLVSEKMPLMREEISSFECGFEHHNLSRVPFSLRYFFLTLIFLLFDLEIVLIIFFPSVIFSFSFLMSFGVLLLFVLILFFSLVYE